MFRQCLVHVIQVRNVPELGSSGEFRFVLETQVCLRACGLVTLILASLAVCDTIRLTSGILL